MATKTLAHGMGTFFKDCEHAESRWSKCPHLYKIRYRDGTGKQTVESGFATQNLAIERLTEIYNAKRSAPQTQRQTKAERIKKYGTMQFAEYTTEWKASQRDLAEASVRHLNSLLENHLYPTLGSRRMATFDHKVVDGFIQTMERNGIGMATQANAYDKLKAILLDAHRLGLYADNPLDGVKPPQYDPERSVIPSVAQLRTIRTAGDDTFLLFADLMSGCGMRNGEAAAVNLNNIVADDVYRITEQVNQTTGTYARLKHRKVGEYRDVPLPASIKTTIEWYADKHGTIEGYLLRHPKDITRPFPYHYLQNQWQRDIKQSEQADIPDGMVVYGFRHFFASNCLTNGIPITDVAEWMGHKSLDITFKIYRHLMPGSIGKAAKILDVGLAV
ncbi:tyrosine-type recombinase/integrase [Streptomyces sp. LHD-70]|uniref:tyrosine-type recombinase/integrase n=1 Tax=Streptomyces sp. LHD-70 TaxID=3072140 RepID=UPI00280C4779|nr:tyrosine-type recombinase/integrase [Streptomyces sp. LHD-70]MDQ8704088.1 tyrosine-type recombinase/integrase [Streptomyces sp. LHD-70]